MKLFYEERKIALSKVKEKANGNTTEFQGTVKPFSFYTSDLAMVEPKWLRGTSVARSKEIRRRKLEREAKKLFRVSTTTIQVVSGKYDRDE